MIFKLAQQLKDAGFPQGTHSYLVKDFDNKEGWNEFNEGEMHGYQDDAGIFTASFYREIYPEKEIIASPTLSELVDACEDIVIEKVEGIGTRIIKIRIGKIISAGKWYKTPEKAVANLWLELNK